MWPWVEFRPVRSTGRVASRSQISRLLRWSPFDFFFFFLSVLYTNLRRKNLRHPYKKICLPAFYETRQENIWNQLSPAFRLDSARICIGKNVRHGCTRLFACLRRIWQAKSCKFASLSRLPITRLTYDHIDRVLELARVARDKLP